MCPKILLLSYKTAPFLAYFGSRNFETSPYLKLFMAFLHVVTSTTQMELGNVYIYFCRYLMTISRKERVETLYSIQRTDTWEKLLRFSL